MGYDFDIIQFRDRYGVYYFMLFDMECSRAFYVGFLTLLVLVHDGSVY